MLPGQDVAMANARDKGAGMVRIPPPSRGGNPLPGQHVTPPNRSSGGHREEAEMGKGILLWLLGIPLPIIIILLLLWH